MIQIENVSKSYGANLVVDGVSLDIPCKQITSIIGPNGAGKSTLLSMIARLLPMDAGTVSVDGLDVTTTPDAELAKRLSILNQQNQIGTRLTIADLVLFGRYPHSKGRYTAEDKTHVEKSIEYLGLSGLRSRYLDELSGGERQRAYVAMVLCQDTDYILLDEPLNNLDMKHAVEMMKLMDRASRELGKTIVIVLHDINFASCYSHKIIAMQNGKIAFQGAPQSVITPETMRKIYEIDIQVHTINGQSISIYYT